MANPSRNGLDHEILEHIDAQRLIESVTSDTAGWSCFYEVAKQMVVKLAGLSCVPTGCPGTPGTEAHSNLFQCQKGAPLSRRQAAHGFRLNSVKSLAHELETNASMNTLPPAIGAIGVRTGYFDCENRTRFALLDQAAWSRDRSERIRGRGGAVQQANPNHARVRPQRFGVVWDHWYWERLA